jgi:hypothetical protein
MHPQWKIFLLNFIIALACSACVANFDKSSRPNYALLPPKTDWLMPLVMNDALDVCLLAEPTKGDDTQNRTNQDVLDRIADQLRVGFETWLTPLRPLSTKISLQGNRLRFLGAADGCEWTKPNTKRASLTVLFNPGLGRARARLLDQSIELFRHDSAGIVLHELGHAFGLADTYPNEDDTPSNVACRSGQPRSVMCPHPYIAGDEPEALREDDVQGIKASWCRTFPKGNTAACATLRPEGPRPALNPDGSPVFSLGVTVRNATWINTIGEKEACAQLATVTPNSAADRAGLKAGMYVVAAMDITVRSNKDLIRAVEQAHFSALTLKVSSGHSQRVRIVQVMLDGGGAGGVARIDDYVHAAVEIELRNEDQVAGRIEAYKPMRVLEVDEDASFLRVRGTIWKAGREISIEGWVRAAKVTRIGIVEE